MEIFLTVLKYIAGPVLGAVIGYFTNWIAVKMLFRPYYPKKIGKWQLPFTPGIIPKRKSALAKAIGRAVGEDLFTKDDLVIALTSDGAKQSVADCAVSLWHSAREKSVDELIARIGLKDNAENIKTSTERFFCDKIYHALQQVNLGNIIIKECTNVIQEKKSSLGMLSMFLSDELIAMVTNKLAEGVNAYIDSQGKQVISKAVHSELENILTAPFSPYTTNVNDETVCNLARTLYEKAVNTVIPEMKEKIDISSIVENKINAMNVKELEKLVLSVMKKELNAIINLGAFIGFILGIILIFI